MVSRFATISPSLGYLLHHATEFTLVPDYGELNDAFSDDPAWRDRLTIAWRGASEEGGDDDRWAILWRHSNCWHNGRQRFVYEHSPGNRTEKFIASTRFTLEEAAALIPKLLVIIEFGGKEGLRSAIEERAARRGG